MRHLVTSSCGAAAAIVISLSASRTSFSRSSLHPVLVRAHLNIPQSIIFYPSNLTHTTFFSTVDNCLDKMTAFSGSSTLGVGTSNYSYFAVPAAWVLAFIPHAYAAAASNGRFKNAHPRQLLHDLLSKKDKTPLDAKLVRAESAQMNG